jgi:ribosome-binding protein aMBF1 (putative translation factor)
MDFKNIDYTKLNDLDRFIYDRMPYYFNNKEVNKELEKIFTVEELKKTEKKEKDSDSQSENITIEEIID